MDKLQHTGLNQVTTNESSSVASSNVQLTVGHSERMKEKGFEMKGLGRILHVSWTAKKTNE